MNALPEIPPGPAAWKLFAAGVLAALRARTPLRSPTCEIDEKADGFMARPRLPPVAPTTAPTFTHTLDGTETLLAWGAGYLTIEIEDTGLPDGTPVSVNTEGLDFPVQFAGAVVDGGTIRLYYQMAADEPPVTMPAGTITVRPIL